MNQNPYIYIHIHMYSCSPTNTCHEVIRFFNGHVKLPQANATTAAWFLREEVADPPGFATFRQKILTLGFFNSILHF